MLFIPIEYYMERIVDVCVTGTLHSVGNDNSYRRMCCSSIGIGIGNDNVIWIGYDIERY